MVIIPIYEVTKTAMTDKVKDKLLQVASISSVEGPYLSRDKGKWIVVTIKTLKTQLKKEVNHILREMTLKIISPAYTDQHGTITREHRNPMLIFIDPNQNVAIPRQTKRLCVVLYKSNHGNSRKEG